RGVDERSENVAALLRAPLRKQHPALAIEGDARDRAWARGFDQQLGPWIAGKASIVVEPDRPDLRAVIDGVIEAAVMHGEAAHAPLALGKSPSGRIVGLEGVARNVRALAVVR